MKPLLLTLSAMMVMTCLQAQTNPAILNWIQNLFTLAAIQPYFKVGAGQLNRLATGTYANGASPNPQTDSLTAVLGLGTRIYVTRSFAIRAELTSYLTGGSIRTYKDNVGMTLGASVAL